MDSEEISHQQSLVNDSFSTIERLESDMAKITREFESLDTKNEEDLTESHLHSTSSDFPVELQSDPHSSRNDEDSAGS